MSIKNIGPDQPLKYEVVDGRIVISIGVETFKFCHNELEHGFESKKGHGSGFLITDATGFAQDVVAELSREREDGSTILTDLLDEATTNAANNGSIHTEERFAWFCEECDEGMSGGGVTVGKSRYCSQKCADSAKSGETVSF